MQLHCRRQVEVVLLTGSAEDSSRAPDVGWLTPVGSGLVGLMFLMAVQIGDQLANPFADGVYDVPMTAITRTIEIDLTQMLGAESPRQVEPVEQVLY